MRIPQQVNFRATGASSSNLGNLDAGDYTLASFQMTSTTNFTNGFGNQDDFSNMSDVGEKNLIVEVSYTDMLGIRRTIQKEVLFELGIGNGGASGGLYGQYGGSPYDFPGCTGTTYIIIGVVGIIAIVAFLKLRKRKKK